MKKRVIVAILIFIAFLWVIPVLIGNSVVGKAHL